MAAATGMVALGGCGGDDAGTATAAKATRTPAATVAQVAETATATPSPAPVPAALRGRWRRVVRSAGVPEGAWRIEVGRKGSTDVYIPRTQKVDFTMQLGTDGRRLTLGPVPLCQSTGMYTWRASGQHLRLAVANDPCSVRAGVFEGTWTRAR